MHNAGREQNRTSQPPVGVLAATGAACTQLFETAFNGGSVEICSRGNVLIAVAFLVGMAGSRAESSDTMIPCSPLLVTVCETK